MEKIMNLELYKTLVSAYKNRCFLSNCFFMMDKARQLIAEDRLFYELGNDNLYLFERREGFYRFYYWIKNYENIASVRCDMPLVVEFVYHDKMTERQSAAVGLLKNMGFEIGRNSARMSVSGKDIKNLLQTENNQVIIVRGNCSECKSIYQMLHRAFHPLYAYLPTEAELKNLINSGDIYVAIWENKLAGVLNMGKEKNQAWIRHLVVNEKFRGFGIGSKLVSEGIINNRDIKDFMCWVDITNAVAIRLYRKFGYEFDGRRADEYVMM